MPFHSEADIETMFDPEMGDGYEAEVFVHGRDSYEATFFPDDRESFFTNVLRDRDVRKLDEFGNMAEKTTLLHFITSRLPFPLRRRDEIKLDGRIYYIETLSKQDTYISSYEAS